METDPARRRYLDVLLTLRTGAFGAAETMLRAHPELISSVLFDESLLNFCVIENEIEAARFLLERGADVEHATGEGGETPLMDAIGQGNTEMLGLLIAYGANPNVQSDVFGWALEYAVDRDNYEAVMLLLRHGADVRRVNGFKESVQQHFRGDQQREILACVDGL